MADNNLPLLVIAGGAALLIAGFMAKEPEDDPTPTPTPRPRPRPRPPTPTPGPTPPQPLVNISVAERPIRMSVRPL